MSQIKTMLNLSKYDKYGRLLLHREQESRSWTIGLISLLYASFSQATVAVPSTSIDDDLASRRVAIPTVPGGGSGYGFGSVHLRVAAPSGNSNVLDASYQTGFSGYPQKNGYAKTGKDIGIVIGTDNTAATPTDRRLVRKVPHGKGTVDGAPADQIVFTGADDQNQLMDAASDWCAQCFTPLRDFILTTAELKIYKAGAPGDLTVEIRSADDVGNSPIAPNVARCNVLSTGTIAEASIPAASPGALTSCNLTDVHLYAGRTYWLVCYAPGASAGNSVTWRWKSSAVYADCPRAIAMDLGGTPYKAYSTNSGVSWTTTAAQVYGFKVIGTRFNEIFYDGCGISNLVTANPNSQFTIRRLFINHCGADITIQEVGIQAPHAFYSSGVPWNQVTLLARDIIGAGGVTVSTTETLEVTYTPQITV